MHFKTSHPTFSPNSTQNHIYKKKNQNFSNPHPKNRFKTSNHLQSKKPTNPKPQTPLTQKTKLPNAETTRPFGNRSHIVIHRYLAVYNKRAYPEFVDGTGRDVPRIFRWCGVCDLAGSRRRSITPVACFTTTRIQCGNPALGPALLKLGRVAYKGRSKSEKIRVFVWCLWEGIWRLWNVGFFFGDEYGFWIVLVWCLNLWSCEGQVLSFSLKYLYMMI